MTKQLDPFDADRFMAGEDAMMRNGVRVKCAGYNENAVIGAKLLGWEIESGNPLSWCGDGRHFPYGDKSKFDITHMAPRVVKREVWLRRSRYMLDGWSTRDVPAGQRPEWRPDDHYHAAEIGPVHTYEVEE